MHQKLHKRQQTPRFERVMEAMRNHTNLSNLTQDQQAMNMPQPGSHLNHLETECFDKVVRQQTGTEIIGNAARQQPKTEIIGNAARQQPKTEDLDVTEMQVTFPNCSAYASIHTLLEP